MCRPSQRVIARARKEAEAITTPMRSFEEEFISHASHNLRTLAGPSRLR